MPLSDNVLHDLVDEEEPNSTPSGTMQAHGRPGEKVTEHGPFVVLIAQNGALVHLHLAGKDALVRQNPAWCSPWPADWRRPGHG